MTNQIKRILNKLYHYKNLSYNKMNEPLYSEDILSEKEQAVLTAYGWNTNDIEHFSGHDETIEKLFSLKNNPLLSKQRCVDAFITGVGGSYPRGRSVLPAWHCLDTLPVHSYLEKTEFRCCWICKEQDESEVINDSEFQFCLYCGNSYTSGPMYAYLNLKHLLKVPAVVPTEEDIKTLSHLLELLRNAPGDETPGKFEKRLRETKLIKGDNNIRRGILNSLALVGVIPNQFIPLSDQIWTDFGSMAIYERELRNTQARSDMEMPWAGWIGSLKINEEKTEELFGEYLKKYRLPQKNFS